MHFSNYLDMSPGRRGATAAIIHVYSVPEQMHRPHFQRFALIYIRLDVELVWAEATTVEVIIIERLGPGTKTFTEAFQLVIIRRLKC